MPSWWVQMSQMKWIMWMMEEKQMALKIYYHCKDVYMIVQYVVCIELWQQ
jgi:hypothetical protein